MNYFSVRCLLCCAVEVEVRFLFAVGFDAAAEKAKAVLRKECREGMPLGNAHPAFEDDEILIAQISLVSLPAPEMEAVRKLSRAPRVFYLSDEAKYTQMVYTKKQ